MDEELEILRREVAALKRRLDKVEESVRLENEAGLLAAHGTLLILDRVRLLEGKERPS